MKCWRETRHVRFPLSDSTLTTTIMSSNAPPTTTSPDRPSTNNPQALLITPNHIPVVTQTEENSPFQGRFSCERSLSMLTGRRYQKTCSPLAEGCTQPMHPMVPRPPVRTAWQMCFRWCFYVFIGWMPLTAKFKKSTKSPSTVIFREIQESWSHYYLGAKAKGLKNLRAHHSQRKMKKSFFGKLSLFSLQNLESRVR